MIDVVLPWEVNIAADKWKWSVGYLSLRGCDIRSDVYRQPTTGKSITRIEKLVEYSLGSRNWIVCVCDSTIYMRSLFSYVMASYIFTTNERAIIVDVDDLIQAVDEPDGELRDIIEFAELLMVCYCDPHNPQLKFKRGAVASIFHRRKQRRLATMVDLFVGSIPDPITEEKRVSTIMRLTDSFGESVHELFTGPTSKHVIVRSKDAGESEPNGKRTDRKRNTKSDNGVLRRPVSQET